MNRIVRLGAAALLLLLVLTERTDADADLTGLVNATFLQRTEDPTLHDLAHQRAQYQVTYSGGVCGQSSLTHTGLTTHEVLACNYTGPERAVQQWVESPTHAAILGDPNLNAIGCATASGSDGALYYACVLTWGDSPPPQEPVPAPPAEVPPPPTPSPKNGSLHEPCNDCSTGEPTPAPVLLPNTALTEP